MEFLFITCQIGAEPAVKSELAREHPELRFAYSRPGFLTFKLTGPHVPLPFFRLRSVFARAWGISRGKVPGESSADRAVAFRDLFAGQPLQGLHVWERDHVAPKNDIPVGRTLAAIDAEALIRSVFGDSGFSSDGDLPIADCVLVEPDEWWAGWHVPRTVPERWPGGELVEPLPETAVSRGWLKMLEMLRWSELPIRKGDTCVEFGSAPGGASQQLLSRGLHVIGVDPAEMHERVLADPRFTHVRARPRDMKKKLFRGIPWLVSDINLPPAYTLDTVAEIVACPGVEFRGMLLTLKLPDWSLAEEIPGCLERIRSWGYTDVRARQLHHNRQEICVAVQ